MACKGIRTAPISERCPFQCKECRRIRVANPNRFTQVNHEKVSKCQAVPELTASSEMGSGRHQIQSIPFW